MYDREYYLQHYPGYPWPIYDQAAGEVVYGKRRLRIAIADEVDDCLEAICPCCGRVTRHGSSEGSRICHSCFEDIYLRPRCSSGPFLPWGMTAASLGLEKGGVA